jgi:hypothetical protein
VVGGSLPGHDDGQEVGERREEVEGNRFPFSPQAGMARVGGSTTVGGLHAVVVRGGGVGEFGR